MKIYEFYNGHPERWTQYALVDGKARCLTMAFHCCYPDDRMERVGARLRLRLKLEEKTGSTNITRFNDAADTTFEDVLQMVKEAQV